MNKESQKLNETLAILKRCYETLDDKKAFEIKTIKVAGKNSITDYFVIASGTSEPHLRALRRELEKTLDELQIKGLKIDHKPDSGWAVIAGFDFMIHLFIESTRSYYQLEDLWKDGEDIDLSKIK